MLYDVHLSETAFYGVRMAGEEVGWPGLSESEESDSEEEALSSSPPAIYGFRSGPGFLVAEEVQGGAVEED